MESTVRSTWAAGSGGRQRAVFQASRSSSTTYGSTRRRSRWPASLARLVLRAPSSTPLATSSRHSVGGVDEAGPPSALATMSTSQDGATAIALALSTDQQYRRPLGWI